MCNGEPLNHLQFCGHHSKLRHRHQSEGERVTKIHVSLREHLQPQHNFTPRWNISSHCLLCSYSYITFGLYKQMHKSTISTAVDRVPKCHCHLFIPDDVISNPVVAMSHIVVKIAYKLRRVRPSVRM
jgi:hypothetical protein